MQDDPLTPLELRFRKAVQICLQTRDEARKRKTRYALWCADVRAAWSEKQQDALLTATETSTKSGKRDGRVKKTGK